ncbi:hypothetical protein [Streptomyces phytophilus]|uniref:hypothetical protein n=1 Tax=Streptomyces phytophilus TaxID=722715 RepID=UPI0015F02CB0|nr:hypothetical protein [Streptomyces phytophilus]
MSRDAVEVPPWRPEMGPRPRVTVYPARNPPRLRVRVDGDWRDAEVMARHDWPSGVIAVQVTIRLPAEDLGGGLQTFGRTYLWDSGAMHVLDEQWGGPATNP